MAITATIMSTDEIHRGEDTSRVLSDELNNIEEAIDALDGAKAPVNHSHTDLESAIEGLEDGKAEVAHTHEMSEINGLGAALAELEESIAAIQSGGGSAAVTPMLVASMHLGKLDNNSGAENSSSTRICSEPFAVEPGKSYWQINDKGVNMYVLLYDADELFVGYMGSFASGAEIAVTNSNAAYMRLGSLLGEYDLSNEFRIYDVNPESGESSSGGATVDAYTKEEADARFAAVAHAHDGYAPADHAHSGYATTDHAHAGYAASGHTHTAADITGLPSSVDAYSKTEADNRFATAGHTHSGYAASNHSHTEYAASGHTHSGYASSSHTHTASAVGAAASNHSHTPASIGAAAANHSHNYASSGHSHTPSEVGAVPATGGTFIGEVEIPYGLGTGSIYPFDSGSYAIGSDSNRYYSTYLRVNPNVSSDRRRKRDIADLNADTLAEFVNALRVVSYNYNDDAENEGKRIGLIAQDLIAVDPGIAAFFVEQSESGFYSLRTADLVFPLIAAVQELSRKIAMLEGNA